MRATLMIINRTTMIKNIITIFEFMSAYSDDFVVYVKPYVQYPSPSKNIK